VKAVAEVSTAATAIADRSGWAMVADVGSE
jgi:hypothetical protein